MSEKCSKWNKNCAREQKVCKGTKNVQGNEKFAWEQNVFLWVKMKFIKIQSNGGKVLSSVVHYGIELPYGGHTWPCMTLCGFIWPHVVVHGPVWPYVALYDPLWSCVALFFCNIMALYRPSWVIDTNLFGFVLLKDWQKITDFDSWNRQKNANFKGILVWCLSFHNF